jgi:hypothetical protein
MYQECTNAGGHASNLQFRLALAAVGNGYWGIAEDGSVVGGRSLDFTQCMSFPPVRDTP